MRWPLRRRRPPPVIALTPLPELVINDSAERSRAAEDVRQALERLQRLQATAQLRGLRQPPPRP